MRIRVLRIALLLGVSFAALHAGLASDTPSTNGVATAQSVLLYEEPRSLTGSISAEGSDADKPLFRFRRQVHRSGDKLTVDRQYLYPDGKPAAEEKVVYEGDSLVSYVLNETQIGALGSLDIHYTSRQPPKGTIEFTYRAEPGGKVKSHRETLAPDTLTSDMVGAFLLAHWQALSEGQSVRCRYLVVPRRETVGFTFIKAGESVWRGRPVTLVRMEATSPLLSPLVKPLIFTMEQAAPHRVLQYAGRTTPKVKTDGKWMDIDAVTVFDWDPESVKSSDHP
jgi:hypothetical protein